MYGELRLPPERMTYNPTNGQFLSGHEPHNKGKQWREWMSKRGQKRAAKGWENLRKYQPKTRPDNSERCRRPVVAIYDDGRWLVLPFIIAAGDWIGGCWENVRRCCQSNLARHVNKKTGAINTDHRYKGIRFYYESDNIWTTKIKEL